MSRPLRYNQEAKLVFSYFSLQRIHAGDFNSRKLPAARKPHVAPKLSPKTHPRENSINSQKRSYLTASCLHIKKKCPYKTCCWILIEEMRHIKMIITSSTLNSKVLDQSYTKGKVFSRRRGWREAHSQRQAVSWLQPRFHFRYQAAAWLGAYYTLHAAVAVAILSVHA